MLQSVEYEVLEQLLVAHADLRHRVLLKYSGT
jgi:hypothetical protein